MGRQVCAFTHLSCHRSGMVPSNDNVTEGGYCKADSPSLPTRDIIPSLRLPIDNGLRHTALPAHADQSPTMYHDLVPPVLGFIRAVPAIS